MTSLNFDYFLALEQDLERYSRYIEFHEDNFNTYSLELVRLLLAAGSEIDVILKELCRRIEPNKFPDKITEYKDIVLAKFPEIEQSQVRIAKYHLKSTPWCGWSQSSPSWWKSYNNVKHDRLKNYKEGNLGNVLMAVSGLGVLMQYISENEDENFRGEFFGGLYKRLQIWN